MYIFRDIQVVIKYLSVFPCCPFAVGQDPSRSSSQQSQHRTCRRVGCGSLVAYSDSSSWLWGEKTPVRSKSHIHTHHSLFYEFEYVQFSWHSVGIRVGLEVFIKKSRFAFLSSFPHWCIIAAQPSSFRKIQTLTLSNRQGKLWLPALCWGFHLSADIHAFWQTSLKTPESSWSQGQYTEAWSETTRAGDLKLLKRFNLQNTQTHQLTVHLSSYLSLVTLFEQSPDSLQHSLLAFLHLQTPQSHRGWWVGQWGYDSWAVH